MLTRYLLVISCILQASIGGNITRQRSDIVFIRQRYLALWLAGHKYFEVDRRRGNEESWKAEERVYYKHFPMPRLRTLHPLVVKHCQKTVEECLFQMSSYSQFSYSLLNIETPINDDNSHITYYPFNSHLELFQFRTSASYYLCWYTLQRAKVLGGFMGLQNCILDLNKLKDNEWVDYTVEDFRKDSLDDPFLCARILFCPDPCYGHSTYGSVPSEQAKWNDPGNPCKNLKDRTCNWDFSNNLNFDSLQRNKFNITCNCAGDREGFEWFSAGELCVDKDECRDIHTKCVKGRKCENTVGSFECMCQRGKKFDYDQDKCIEHVPLPQHSYARSGRVKAHKQKSAFMRMVEYILGIRKDNGM